MEAVHTVNRDAVRNNIAYVLSDIFSAKHDCKINFRFEPKNANGRENV